jgi:hypothetical protein
MDPLPSGLGASNTRSSTFAFILLSLISCNIYPTCWLASLCVNLNRTGALRKRCSTRLVIASGAIFAWSLFLPYIVTTEVLDASQGLSLESSPVPDPSVIWIADRLQTAHTLDILFSLAYLFVAVAAALHMAGRLREYFRDTGTGLGVSGIAAFFFGVFYIYYKVRQANLLPEGEPSWQQYPYETRRPDFGMLPDYAFQRQPPQPGHWQQPQPGHWQQPQPGHWQQPQQGQWQQPQQGQGQQTQPVATQQHGYVNHPPQQQQYLGQQPQQEPHLPEDGQTRPQGAAQPQGWHGPGVKDTTPVDGDASGS